MRSRADVTQLVHEYENMKKTTTSREAIARLIADHDWSREAASEILTLARTKGAFLLRNALALSIVMDVEDGDQGF